MKNKMESYMQGFIHGKTPLAKPMSINEVEKWYPDCDPELFLNGLDDGIQRDYFRYDICLKKLGIKK